MDIKREIASVIRGNLRRSIAVSPAEKALREANDPESLDAAWDQHCAEFPDESVEREHLLTVYHERQEWFALRLVELLRA